MGPKQSIHALWYKLMRANIQVLHWESYNSKILMLLAIILSSALHASIEGPTSIPHP